MSRSETYTCPRHNLECVRGAYCPSCHREYAELPDPANMTPDERVAELERWWGILTIPFADVHKRIEALAGCPVWTHQLIEQEWLRDVARRRNGDDNCAEIAIDHLGKYGKPIIEVAHDPA